MYQEVQSQDFVIVPRYTLLLMRVLTREASLAMLDDDSTSEQAAGLESAAHDSFTK